MSDRYGGAYAQLREAFVERLTHSAIGAFDIAALYIGERLGFYQLLAEHEWLSARELAEYSRTDVRYVREWLEQQSVTGILELQDPSLPPDERRFHLPAAHAEVLADHNSLHFLAPLGRLLIGALNPIAQVVEAYARGEGLSAEVYGEDYASGAADLNRSAYLQLLGGEWLPSIRDIHARLLSETPARVADMACGAGWAAIGMAQAYPNISVDAFDVDASAVAQAHNNADIFGLGARIHVEQRDLSQHDLNGEYDLVTAFNCVHSVADPLAFLATMRRIVADDGAVLVVESRVGEQFTGQADAYEELRYGLSLVHSLPVSKAELPSAETGAILRASTLRDYALQAGFSDVKLLRIEHPNWHFYQLYL